MPAGRAVKLMSIDAHSPDGLCIAAALTGDEEAFGCLVARYEAALRRAAISRVGRRELAEEVVQETLLCAHRWLATYDSRFSFRTWLWAILLNQCARHGKREAKQRALGAQKAVQGDCRGADPLASPLAQLLARETSERLHALLGSLPELQADALRLRFFGGLTFPEIAAAMQCSEAGAKHRVKTGLIKLGAAITRPGPAAREAAAEHGPAGGLSSEGREFS